MTHVRKFISLSLLAAYFLLAPSGVQANATVDLYGTFNAMGITVSFAETGDPDMDAHVAIEYRTGVQPYQNGFPLSRISATRFVGSLFWLEPGTDYDVRITFTDPDGGTLDNLSLEATASTQSEITIPDSNNTYFVDPGGNGSDCSLASPCSLSEGIRLAQPGDEVVLRGGIYYQGDIYLPRSGMPDAPIVIRSHTNERAILDGADPKQTGWVAIGGGVFRSSSAVADTKLVIADSVRLYPYPTLADLQTLPWGIPGFYTDGADLYVHLASDTDPNTVAMNVSRYTYGINVQHDYIYLENLTFRHYGAIPSSRAITFKDASNNLVHGCTFAFNMMGIHIKDQSHRNVIQNNTFYDAKYSWPWDAVKAASRLEQGGLDFSASSPGRGTVIRRNTFHDFFDAFSICPQDPIVQTNETDVYENLVYRAGDDGVQTDGWCSNVRLWNNTFYDVLTGISFAPVIGGPVYAMHNLIFRFGAGNNTHSGRSFKFNSRSGNEFGPIFLFHNTVDSVRTDAYGLSISGVVSGTSSLVYARNNIWSGSPYALRNKELSFPVDLDYDNLYNRNDEDLVRWGSDIYTDLPAFNSESGQEINGLNTDPGFGAAQCGKYDLNATSSLIDAGLFIPGINDNYLGLAPDIGAFEHNGADPTCVDERPSIRVEKSTSTPIIDEPHGTAHFTTSIFNTTAGPDPVIITSLTDDLVAEVTMAGNSTCRFPHTIQSGESYTCSFESDIAGNAGETYIYTTVAAGIGLDGIVVSAADSAAITFNVDTPFQPARVFLPQIQRP